MDFKPERLLEIGFNVGSMWLWHELYPKCELYGIDKNLDIGTYPKSKLIILDFKDIKNLPKFDLIIDDSSHLVEDQKYILQNFRKFLNPGGWLIVEDVKNTLIVDHFKDDRMFLVDQTFLRPHNVDEKLIIYRNDIP
jgi:trans-aconitate methyltransferase